MTHIRGRRVTRPITLTAAIIVAASLLAGCAGEAPAAESSSGAELSGRVVWADYGGPTHEARLAAYLDDFATETGVEVVSTTVAEAAANIMYDGGSGDYDLIQSNPEYLYNYSDNLEVLPDSVPRSDTVPEDFRDYAVGSFIVGLAQGWLTDTYADGGPQDWADFFDTEAFPGKRAWPGSPAAYDASFEIALLADGVAPEDLYPIDFERARAKLDELKPDMVFYTAYPEVQQLLSSNTASIAVSVHGQFNALANAGYDVTVQWNEAFLNPNFFVIPSGAASKENAFALAAFLAADERQAPFVEATAYGPANTSVLDLLSEDVLKKIPNSTENSANTVALDFMYRAQNQESYLNEYTEWLSE